MTSQLWIGSSVKTVQNGSTFFVSALSVLMPTGFVNIVSPESQIQEQTSACAKLKWVESLCKIPAVCAQLYDTQYCVFSCSVEVF